MEAVTGKELQFITMRGDKKVGIDGSRVSARSVLISFGTVLFATVRMGS